MRRYLLFLLVSLVPMFANAQIPAPSPAPATPAENLIRFDYHTAELRRTDDGWYLTASGQPLKHFQREADARQALKLVHDLRLTQHGTIGTPQPVIEYWLSDGGAPLGLVSGMNLTPIDANSVRAEPVRGQWVLRDDRRTHFTFGSQEADARQAATIIRKYGFNQVGFVGLETPSMMYFLVHHNTKDNAQIVRANGTAAMTQEDRPQSVLPEGAGKPQVYGQVKKSAGKGPAVPTTQPMARQLVTPALPSAKAVAPVDRAAFDWRTVQLRRDGNDWKLVSGSYTLANFGRSEREAKLALTVVQRYRFTEQYAVGRPKPACTYFLTYGQAPRGLHFGVSSVSFRPEALKVEERDGGFTLVEGHRTLLHFGENQQDARQMLQVIQQHKFDHWCHVGRTGQGGMTFFVRAR